MHKTDQMYKTTAPPPGVETGFEIAVIGMAGRFPGAKHIYEFWENLKKGIESISFFSHDELINAGVESGVLNDSNYIKSRSILESIDYFDSSFFGYSPAEAEVMDPQVRIFHECVWEALEDAGYDPGSYNRGIGLYAGASANNEWIAYAMHLVAAAPEKQYSASLLFDKDFLATQVAYKLNLKGPGSTIFTACSTALVAIHEACQGLLSNECKMALAGGVTATNLKKQGDIYQEGMLLSPDGRCRAFDANANGTVFGDGVGVVVLKQLETALEDRDHIYAVVKGSAVNNDGNRKVGYTAPSITGQADVIRAALRAAEVEPESIGYIETHGTGTIIGDPIEIEALTQAFGTTKKNFCPIGSVKTNVGHLDIAAGVVSFIKAVLILQHQLIPPSLFFHTPNPEIDFDNSPFYVNTGLEEWKPGKSPRRIGVSSFGIGGTNAHVILEEWPHHSSNAWRTAHGAECRGGPLRPPTDLRQHQLILLSAKTQSALDKMTKNLAEYFKKNLLNHGNQKNPINPGQNPHLNLEDAAYTLQTGRSALEYRTMLLGSHREEAVQNLLSPGSQHRHQLTKKNRKKRVVFMFPGQGSQYVDMGLDLYNTEPVFRREMDCCFDILKPLMDYDVKELLYPSADFNRSNRTYTSYKSNQPDIHQTEIAQPMIFIIEYALAKLLMYWGIQPDAMIGHSIGEYTAACLAGVFTLEDALKLVVLRGKLMQCMPTGAMLSVQLPEEKLKPLLNEEISLAAVNGPSLCVVSGSHNAMETFEKKLKQKNRQSTRLNTSHAFHSKMMDPVVKEFKENLRHHRFYQPGIPFLANVTGQWMTDEEAVSPQYWAAQIRNTVRFSDGIAELLKEKNNLFLEVGPGQVLSTLVRKQAIHSDPTGKTSSQQMINLMRYPQEEISDSRYLLTKIGLLWLYGKSIDWTTYYSKERRYRVSLPTYPFQRQRFWAAVEGINQRALLPQKKALDQWFYIPSWKRSFPAAPNNTPSRACCLVFIDSLGTGDQLVQRLTRQARDVITVRIGQLFEKIDPNEYTLSPHSSQDYDRLFKDLAALNRFPDIIIHMWNITGADRKKSLLDGLDYTLDTGFYSLLSIVQAIGKKHFQADLRMWIVTDHMQEVVGGELKSPLKAALSGLAQVINQEYPHMDCRSIDVVLPPGESAGTTDQEVLTDQLLTEILVDPPGTHRTIAFRDMHRWVQDFEPLQLKDPGKPIPRLREKGVYLITGGLGGIGLVLARHLADSVHARLILTGRSNFPDKDQWEQCMIDHDPDDPVSKKIKKLKELEKSGAEVMVFCTDVTNPEQMQELITRAKERFGSINGVIHAAGIADGALILRRTREMSEKILAPKVKGTLVLHHVLQDESLDFFMLCSSVYSVLGGMGQAGYCAANAFLDAFAFYNTREHNIFTLAVDWDLWQEVGIMVNLDQPKLEYKKVTHPIFTKYMKGKDNIGIFVAQLNVKKYWFLDEHRAMGSALVPGTVYLEMARAAFQLHVNAEAVEIRNLYFLNPLLVSENENKELQIVLKKQEDQYEFFFITRSNIGNREWMPHARGEITTLDIGTESRKQYDIKNLEARCNQSKKTIPQEGNILSGGFLTFGARWNCLREINSGQQEGLALVQLVEAFSDDVKTYQLHPALLDVATSFILDDLDMALMPKEPYLPFSYKQLRMKAPIPKRFFSYSRYVELTPRKPETLMFDLLILDEQGRECIEIQGFTLLTVQDEGKIIAQQVRDTFPLSPDISLFLPKSTPMESRTPDLLSTGIRPSEGIEVFNRVLESPIPQVVVSTRDLMHMREQIDTAMSLDPRKTQTETLEPGTRPTQPRPELSSVYAAPQDEVEQILAGTLEQYFGIDRIGIHDNFFELGATSLDFAQVIGPLGKAVNREIPLAVMFSYPTLRDLRNYLRQEKTDLEFSHTEIKRLEKKNIRKQDKLKVRKNFVKQKRGKNE